MDVKHNCARDGMDDFAVIEGSAPNVAFVLCKGCGAIVGTVTSPRYLKQLEEKLDRLIVQTRH